MRAIALSILLLAAGVAALPLASAECDPTGTACATVGESSEGTSCVWQGEAYGATYASVLVAGSGIAVVGLHRCSRHSYVGAYEETSIDAGASTPAGSVRVFWGEVERHDHYSNGHQYTCAMGVSATAAGTQAIDCPMSPPNPGWGQLLP